MPAAGTPAGARAWRWLQRQGVAVTLICGLVVDADAGRLASFLAKAARAGVHRRARRS